MGEISALAEISTNVRSDLRPARLAPAQRPPPPAWLRVALRVASSFASPLAARWAERAFLTPPRMQPRAHPVLDSGHRFYVHAGGHRLAVWSWGDGPTALLLHGWGGRSEQLAPFVPPLLAAGFSVIAPDAPGHGESSGRRSSMLAFAEALEAVASRVGPVRAFIGHSGGAAAGAFALHRGLRVQRAVFIAPVASLAEVVGRYASELHIPPWTAEDLRRRIEARVGVPMADLEVTRVARSARTPLLVFHDPDDRNLEIAKLRTLHADLDRAVLDAYGWRNIPNW